MPYAPSPPSGAYSGGRPGSAKMRNDERAREVVGEASDALLLLMEALEGDIATADQNIAAEAKQIVTRIMLSLSATPAIEGDLKSELMELSDQLGDGLALWDEAYKDATTGAAAQRAKAEERRRLEEKMRQEQAEKEERERKRKEAKARMDAIKEKKRLEAAAREEQELLQKQLDDARLATEVVEQKKKALQEWEEKEAKFQQTIADLKRELEARPAKQSEWISQQTEEEEKLRAQHADQIESEKERLEREAREREQQRAAELVKQKEEEMRRRQRELLAQKDEELKKKEADMLQLEQEMKQKFDEQIQQIREEIERVKNAPPPEEETNEEKEEYEARVKALEDEIATAQEEAKHIDRPMAADEALREVERLRKLYMKEMNERKKLYNELVDMKGSIRVYVRVRPMKEEERKYRGGVETVGFPTTEKITVGLNAENTKPKTFDFDRVFEPACDQPEVFEDTLPVITSVVDGYNVCIFAYGQTGAGKSYTMTGSRSNPGVMKRSLKELFRLLDERRDTEDNQVDVAVLEIYNEQIRDLQVPAKQQKKYAIKTDNVRGQYVENLTFTTVNAPDDIDDIMNTADSHRSVGKTNMNAHSSRSHMILYIQLTIINKETNRKIVSKLSLIDLAGSERLDKSGAEGKAMLEAQHINKSLSALGDVISSLSHRSKHTPYRNSTLTHLLQDSLGGRAKTLMFANCSPLSGDLSESLSTLQFASRAHGVELGKATKNVSNV